jgi:hypothetical protein
MRNEKIVTNKKEVINHQKMLFLAFFFGPMLPSGCKQQVNILIEWSGLVEVVDD